MKRGVFIVIFLFLMACFLPLALAPPAQANGTRITMYNDVAITTVQPTTRDRFGPANGMFAEANQGYIGLMKDTEKIHGVWDTNSLTQPGIRSLEVSYMLKIGEEPMGNKGNATKL
jgi:hypothetical protein